VEHEVDRDDAERQRAFDLRLHGSLRIFRSARPQRDINLLDVRCLGWLWSHVDAIRRLTGAGTKRVHALRAFPERIAGYLFRQRYRRSARLLTYAHGEEVLIARTSRQLKWMAKRVYAGSDLVIANSENTRRLVLELCPSARVTVIHPGVNVAAFACDARVVGEYRAQWNWPSDTVIVSTLARMEPRKNHATVIRAVSELRARGLAVAYVCGGEGPERDRLEELAERVLMPWVRFPGRIAEEDKARFFLASDLFAMPSIRLGEMIEGFGIVFIEAAAAGLPSVCGDTGGQAEAVLDGRTGLVVDGASVDQVSAAIGRLAADQKLRGEMGHSGKAWAARHDWHEVARSTWEEVSRLCG
jgi:phosphatidylinositol alpha-1,6-mannosyltransferase